MRQLDPGVRQVRGKVAVRFQGNAELPASVPVNVLYDQLTTQNLKDIMIKSEGSALLSYVHDFKAWGIDLICTDEALTEIAQRAEQEGTGARGLISIIHRVLLEDMYRLPGTHRGKFVVDENYVRKRLE